MPQVILHAERNIIMCNFLEVHRKELNIHFNFKNVTLS